MNANTKTKLADCQPEEVAHRYLDSIRQDQAGNILFLDGEYFTFKGGCYVPFGADQVKSELTKWLEEQRYYGLKRSVVLDVVEIVKAISTPDREVRDNDWMTTPKDETKDWEAKDLLCTPDSLINLEARRLGKSVWKVPADHRYFSVNAVAHNFDSNVQQPVRWLEFLHSVWPEDPDSILLLQEFFGYCLTADNTMERMLFLIGKPRAGKSLIQSAIQAVVGERNCNSMSLNDLSDKFAASSFVRKSVGIIGDSRHQNGGDRRAIELLLNITGNDPQTLPRKYLEPIRVRLGTRLILASNETPWFIDGSGALNSRLLLLNFDKSFAGREDTSLKRDVRREAKSILAWAVEGFNRLRENGRFTEPESSLCLRQEFKTSSSPVSCFVDDRCSIDGSKSTPLTDLFKEFEMYARYEGIEEVPNHGQFSKEVRSLYRGLIKSSRPRVDGERVTVLDGIGLKDEDDPSAKTPSNKLRIAPQGQGDSAECEVDRQGIG
ncbi:DNA primase family protein [Rhodopirellula europaea]|uniref:DNA primase family protein n=1 Tax=Rhodopirellula europaea TaxID=1263866 RepID=UPI003D266EFB